MSNQEPKQNIDFIATLHSDITKQWNELNNATKVDATFWDKVSILRKSNRDFFTAFGNISRTDKVKHWNKLNDISLIATIIE